MAGALDRAVDRALGDRPDRAGLLLSGGIDSVSLAALAARRHALPTFTVLAQSTFGNGDARGARVAAEKLGLPNHQVLAPWQPDTIRPDDWRRLLWQTETPDCGAQHWYKASLHAHARAAYPELAVMLNGEGADELFGADFRNQDE